MSETIRLQKYLAQCGIASRRKSEEIIRSGRVKVDGITVTELGTTVSPETQNITVDDREVRKEEEKVYLLLNKPKGYVTTLSDPQGRPIVTDLIREKQHRLFPVGRLDIDTEGALILTNDGALAQRIQHPRNEVTKTYESLVSGFPSKATLKKIDKGFPLEGKITAPAKTHLVKRFTSTSLIAITIHEGRKRQVRKMFAAVGHPVVNLKRIAYGSLYLKKLPEGGYRSLTPKDLAKIFKNIPLQTKK